jgi:diguanylate cyclase (GGDEF)-like protein
MQKNNNIKIIISLIIILGIFAISYYNYIAYSRIIKDDILNISKLTTTNIFSEIENELTKPIFVSLTMANDSFVKQWLNNESNEDLTEITTYLDGIHDKYDYHSVFLISKASQIYYHYNGQFKNISKNNDHDQWYYVFLNQPNLYALDVDQDEVDNQRLTIFVNAKIIDNQGETLGVTGVGIEMSYIQSLLKKFEENYNLEAFLINEDGLIQAHTNEDLIENCNINEIELYQIIGPSLYNKNDDINVFDINKYLDKQYVISHYIEEFDWYLIVKKDTSIIAKTLNSQIIYDIIVIIFILLSLFYTLYYIIKKQENELKSLAILDTLGILTNRKDFDSQLECYLKENETNDKPWSVFLLDIDHFKDINDTHGHLQGDRVLKHIMVLSKHTLEGHLITRWGGDELSGIINLNCKDAEKLLDSLRLMIQNDSELSKLNITISIGVTEAISIDTEDTIVKRADQALYNAKSNGRNQIAAM